MIKALKKLGIQRLHLKIIKAYSQHYSAWRKPKSISPKITGTRQDYPLSPLLFNTLLEILATVIRQEKEIKRIQIRKE
jgi:hypothetical protein